MNNVLAKSQEPWEEGLTDAAKQLMHEIIAQIPEGAARFAFVQVLNRIAAPSAKVTRRLQKLEALEASGVDNWEWYDDAMADLNDDEEEDEDDDN